MPAYSLSCTDPCRPLATPHHTPPIPLRLPVCPTVLSARLLCTYLSCISMKNESLLIVLGISFQLCNGAVCLISLLYRVYVCMYVYFVHSMYVYYQIWLTVTGKTYCDFLDKSQAFFPFLKFNQLLFFHWTTKYNTTVNWDLEKCNNMGYFRNSIVNINYDKSHWNNDNKLKWGTTCVFYRYLSTLYCLNNHH